MRHNVPVTLEVVSTVRPCSQSFTQCGCAGSRFYRVVVLAFDSPVQSRSTSGRQSGRARHWLSNAVLLAAGSTAQSCSMCWQLLPRCGHASNGTNTEVVCAFAPTVRSGSLLAQAQLSDRAYSPPCRYQGARTDWDHCVRGVSNQDAVGQSDQRAVVDWVQRAMQASDQCDMGPGHSDRRALQDLDQHAMSDSDPRAGGDLDQRAVSVLEQRAVQDCDQCLDDSDRLRPAGCDSYQRTIGASDQQAAVHSSQRAAGNSDIHAVEDVAQGAAGDSDLSAMVDSDQMAVRDSNQSAGVDSVLRATGHSGQRAMHYSYQRVVGYLDPRPAVNPSQYAAACLYQHVMADSDQRAEGAPDQRVAGDSDLRAVDDSDQTTAVDSDQSAVADLDRRDPDQCAVCDATERRTGGYSAVEARMNSGVEVRGIGSRRGIIRVTQGFPLADQCAHQSGTSWSPTVHDQLNPKISPYSTASQPSRTLSGPAAESMNSRRKMVAPNTDGPYDSPLLEVSLGHSRELLSKSLLIAVIVQLFVLHYTLLSFPLIRKAPNTFSSPSSAWRRRQRRNTSSKRAFDTAVRFALLGSGTALAILELSETSLDENLCRLFLICSAVYIAPSSRRSIGIMPNKIPVNPFAKPTEDTSESSSKTSQQQSKKRQPSNQDRKVASMTSTSAAAAAVADNAETIAYREAGRQHLGKIPAEDARRILEFWKEPDGYARSGKLLEIKAKRRCDPFVEGQTCTLMVQGVCTQTDDDGVAAILQSIDPSLDGHVIRKRLVQMRKLANGQGRLVEFTAWQAHDVLVSRRLLDFAAGLGPAADGPGAVPNEIYIERCLNPDLALKIHKTGELNEVIEVLMAHKFTKEQIAAVLTHSMEESLEGTPLKNQVFAVRFRPCAFEQRSDDKGTKSVPVHAEPNQLDVEVYFHSYEAKRAAIERNIPMFALGARIHILSRKTRDEAETQYARERQEQIRCAVEKAQQIPAVQHITRLTFKMNASWAKEDRTSMMNLAAYESEPMIKKALGGEGRGVESVAVEHNSQGQTQWKGRACIVVFDNRSDTPLANRLLAMLKKKPGSNSSGAVIPQAGTKLSQLSAQGEIQIESSDRSRWSTDNMDTDDVVPDEVPDDASRATVEFALGDRLWDLGSMFIPRVDRHGRPIVMTPTKNQQLTPLSDLPVIDLGAGGGTSALTDIREALADIPGVTSASLFAAIGNLIGISLMIYEEDFGDAKVFMLFHALKNPHANPAAKSD